MTDRSLRSRGLKMRRRRSAVGGVEPMKQPVGGSSSTSTLIDAAVYIAGDRIAPRSTLADTYSLLRAQPAGMAWIGLYRPSEDDIASLADEFHLHELAVEDAIVAHQRPKLERYDDTLFVVLRAARYVDETEEVEFGELHVFVGPDFVVSLRHSEAPDLTAVRRRMESNPDLLALGPEAVLYAIMDKVVDGYLPVVAGLENDIDEIETEVFGGTPRVSQRIYELSREVVDFQRATRPLIGMIEALMSGFEKYETDEELRRYLRDVADHVDGVVDRLEGFRQLLRDMLTVNATLVAQQQNEETAAQNEEIKKISAWAAILFAPTLIGTIYGMNFVHIPELDWALGYPMALGLMVLVCVTLFVVFKRRNWL